MKMHPNHKPLSAPVQSQPFRRHCDRMKLRTTGPLRQEELCVIIVYANEVVHHADN